MNNSEIDQNDQFEDNTQEILETLKSRPDIVINSKDLPSNVKRIEKLSRNDP